MLTDDGLDHYFIAAVEHLKTNCWATQFLLLAPYLDEIYVDLVGLRFLLSASVTKTRTVAVCSYVQFSTGFTARISLTVALLLIVPSGNNMRFRCTRFACFLAFFFGGCWLAILASASNTVRC